MLQIRITLIGIALSTLLTAQVNTAYYYINGEKHKLNKVENKVVLRYKAAIGDSSATANKIKDGVFSKSKKKAKIDIKKLNEFEVICYSDVPFNDISASSINSQPDIDEVHPFYRDSSGMEMAPNRNLFIKLLPNVPFSKIESIIRENKLLMLHDKDYLLFEVPKNAGDVFVISNKIYETGLVEYAHPDFYAEKVFFQRQTIPNDSYFNFQWNLHNTGQVINDGHTGTVDADIDAPEAWSITKGSNAIVVAVIDQGVTDNHPDLPNTRQIRLNGSNFGGGDVNNPSPTSNLNHGNACAGIIGAQQGNSQGISGIAPLTRIMPIRSGSTAATTVNEIDFAINNGADIISCSWGWSSANQNLYPAVVDALRRATTTGRRGLGCIVVFAAGNTADLAHANNGFVSFPANADVPGLLTVGASDRFDREANYSALSNLIDIVAPSHRAYPSQIAGEDAEIWTIDIPGTAGYNPAGGVSTGVALPNSGTNFNNYTGRMGGTSSACPQVAAVAALMLGLRPGLTQIQTFAILTQTADKVGGYVYNNGRCDQMGSGRLNAYNAVKRAISFLPGLYSH